MQFPVMQSPAMKGALHPMIYHITRTTQGTDPLELKPFDFESKHEPLLSRRLFAHRVIASFTAATLLIIFSLAVGMLGYRWLEGLEWIDAFINASMILSGMGPMFSPVTFHGKLFAGIYALYSGLALILAAGLLFSPVIHRVLHRFHLEEEEGE
jgi:hypothetical protein